MLLLIAGAVIAVAIGMAALYDRRARRRGWRVSAGGEKFLYGGIGARAQTINLVHRKTPMSRRKDRRSPL